MIPKCNSLTKDEVKRFHQNGFTGPYTLCSPAEMSMIKKQVYQLFSPTCCESNLPSMISALNPYMQLGFGRHHQHRFIFDIANSEKIKNKVASILGEDLLLWRSMFFCKEPGEKEIPWHQDYDGWEIEPMIVVSCWLAIDDTTISNGCVELLPESHRKYYPLIPSPKEVMDGFPQMANIENVDLSARLSMELKSGQFFLFNERILHRSQANRTNQPRMGLAIRYIPTLVRILDQGDKAILINGQDRLEFNPLVFPPN